MEEGPILPKHGGYRNLDAYKLAEIIYDATTRFADLFVNPRSRTVDQMVQAARSGKQNIAEGSMASGTSKKIELKLIGIARASLEELKLDYEDFLRQNQMSQWDKDHPKSRFIRNLASNSDKSYLTYKTYVEDKGPENAANTVLCVIHQANYRLDKLKSQLEKAFLENGGITERIYRARKNQR